MDRTNYLVEQTDLLTLAIKDNNQDFYSQNLAIFRNFLMIVPGIPDYFICSLLAPKHNVDGLEDEPFPDTVFRIDSNRAEENTFSVVVIQVKVIVKEGSNLYFQPLTDEGQRVLERTIGIVSGI